jgi:tRNA dimethylallyltransferase
VSSPERPLSPQAGAAEILVVAGPTGVGKSAVAAALASAIGGEIVNCDSVQIYRHFDIGSAKPSPDERVRVPHHLFDVIEAVEPFNAADYAKAAERVCNEIAARGSMPVLVGGTGFYLRAFLSGLPEMPEADPQLRARIRSILARPRGRELLHRRLTRIDPDAAARIDPADRHRIERAMEVWMLSGRPISSWAAPRPDRPARRARIFALTRERSALNHVLDERVEEMYRAGLIRETQLLLEKYPVEARPFRSIGYLEAVRFLHGELTRENAIAETKRRTRAYAKRQMTWLRGEPSVHWIDTSGGADAALQRILDILRQG